MIKRKGQIVPKYLCKSIEKKAQHLIKFGCDVEIKGNTIKAISNGRIIEIPSVKYVLKNKRQKTWKGATIKALQLVLLGREY